MILFMFQRGVTFMIKRREFRVPSSDGKSGLHTVLWEPDGEVRQLLLISHGMTEHILRYDPFARFLAEQGIAVIGHDHLGHGGTVQNGRYGYFADKVGHVCASASCTRGVRCICWGTAWGPFSSDGILHCMGKNWQVRSLWEREIRRCRL